MNADSVKARLKNFAVETGHTFQETLACYGLENYIFAASLLDADSGAVSKWNPGSRMWEK